MGIGATLISENVDIDATCVRCGEADNLKVYHPRLELTCTECDVFYPLVHGNIPVLNEDALTEESKHPHREAEKQQRRKEKGLDNAHEVSVK